MYIHTHKYKADEQNSFSYFNAKIKCGPRHKMLTCRNDRICIPLKITLDTSNLNSQIWVSTSVVLSTKFLDSS